MNAKLAASFVLALGLCVASGASALSLSTSSSAQSVDISITNDAASLWLFGGGSEALSSAASLVSSYAQVFETALRSLGNGFYVGGGNGWGWGKGKRPRDAGYVPEPGAVAVFSLGTIIAAASIQALRKKS